MISRIASKTILNCLSYLRSSDASLRASSSWVARMRLSLTNIRMISMFTNVARLLLRTLESMATPCSVNAYGRVLRPPQIDVTICDFKLANSSLVSWNMKSSGNLSTLRFTACTNALVSTPYMAAKSWSSITLLSRIKKMAFSNRKTGRRLVPFSLIVLEIDTCISGCQYRHNMWIQRLWVGVTAPAKQEPHHLAYR
jgi:hypothetical protein